MKSGELMLGNWVENGIYMQVVGLHKNDTVYLDFDGNEGDTWEVDFKDIKGIPLSSEILEKSFGFGGNDFVEIFDDSYIIWNGTNVMLQSENNNEGDIESVVINLLHIQYVHQLQNLLNALGIDLKIKL